MKFRRLPIEVEAVQFTQEMYDARGKLAMPEGVVYGEERDGFFFVINTLEGRMHVRPGDWVVTGVEGERWAIKQSIFEKTYVRIIEMNPCPKCKSTKVSYRGDCYAGMGEYGNLITCDDCKFSRGSLFDLDGKPEKDIIAFWNTLTEKDVTQYDK